jgi:2'-5' RNA ligase
LIRAFIAINLDPQVVEEIAKVQAVLKNVGGDVRWARPEGFHLTLKFLGDIQNNQVSAILAALQNVLKGQNPLSVVAQSLGAFPHIKRPRVLWVGLQGEGLKELNNKIEQELIFLDFPPEDRDFSPHITLGRVRSLKGWEKVLPVMQEKQAERFGESRVDEVVLYRSELKPDGAVYTALGKVSLVGDG